MLLQHQEFLFSFLEFEHSLFLEIFLTSSALSLLLWVLILQNEKYLGFFHFSNLAVWTSILILVLALEICVFSDFLNSFFFSLASNYSLDTFANFSRFFTLFSSLSFFLISLSFFKEFPEAVNEFCCCVLLAICSLIFLASVLDFLSLFLCIELQGLSFYILASFRRTSDFSIEAGVKYFITGAVASCFLLFAISLIYGVCGTLNFMELKLFCENLNSSHNSRDVLSLQLGLFFFICAFLFKLGVAPFHFWVADVYEGSPTHVTAFFSLVPKASLFIVLFRIFFDTFFCFFSLWQPIFLQSALLSVAFGTFGALVQRRLKRLLAYSTVGHTGFLMLAVSSFVSFGTSSVFNYLTIYLITTIALFLFVLNVRERNCFTENPTFFEALGIVKTNPMLGLGLALPLFSLAGLPPFVGFFAKFQMFLASINAGFFLAPVLTVFLSVIASYYYIRIVKVHFFEESSFSWGLSPCQISSLLISLSCGVLLILTANPKLLLFF